MEAAQIGVVRDSMLANPLLIRSRLGKTRSRGLSFPGPDFVYGMATTVRDGGVPEAISHWHSQSRGQSSARAKMGEKDFVALNREGVKSGLVTAKEHYQYRASHDIRRLIPARAGTLAAPPKIPDITFGAPTRPSTPIAGLMEHQYSKSWLEEQRAKGQARLERRHKRARLGCIPETRTTILRKSCPIAEPPSLWKLPRFQEVGPALDTFRSPEARKVAFSAHYSDSVARRGHLGQGTYNLA
ncbi:cilia- and flagella-associated protein 77 [Conger conger]|uniref:cilia- and flagella-associated protein 77 n=1 Tax=Conger conger TaxID=82655 RepID=UPI002A59CE3A|nr:cilia- and flagella-associated protein 77 [Conger conger]XP_061117827.1 cilia- and flagella-associated protein 77 [Conger conger]XP_061117828.1 cilia- and flagella-associated protein 77 [Conger conger]